MIDQSQSFLFEAEKSDFNRDKVNDATVITMVMENRNFYKKKNVRI